MKRKRHAVFEPMTVSNNGFDSTVIAYTVIVSNKFIIYKQFDSLTLYMVFEPMTVSCQHSDKTKFIKGD